MDVAEAMKSISFRYYNKYPGFEGDEFEMLDNKVRHNFDVHGTLVPHNLATIDVVVGVSDNF